MLGIGMPHLLLLAAIALIAIGPKQLPEVARVIGRFLNDLKRVRDEFTRTIVESRDNVNQSFYDQQSNHQPDHSANHVADPSADQHTNHILPTPPLHEAHSPHMAEPPIEPAIDEKDQMAFDLNQPTDSNKKDS